ncbi:MAG: hypothetical protein ACJ0HV_04675 [Candidatus Pseudothioglobus sp.]
MVLRDNFYGSLEDDVFRRDFTINGLYFDVQNSDDDRLCWRSR